MTLNNTLGYSSLNLTEQQNAPELEWNKNADFFCCLFLLEPELLGIDPL